MCSLHHTHTHTHTVRERERERERERGTHTHTQKERGGEYYFVADFSVALKMDVLYQSVKTTKQWHCHINPK